jgi:tetratricopeptide (TPR) repeat protein
MSDVRVVSPVSDEPEAIADYANGALEAGDEEVAIPVVRAAAERHNRPVLWHWLGLLQRSLDDHEDALVSLETAAKLAPRGPRIAQALAHTAMEAGLPAVELFERALELAPQDGAVIVGLAAARNAVGEGERAAAGLAKVLEQAPLWTYGHEQFAQFQSTLGRPHEATASLERALVRFPAAQQLWETLLYVQLRRGAYEALRDILDRARHAGVSSGEFAIYEAIDAAEFASETQPLALFDGAPRGRDSDLDRWRIRHLLRIGAPDAAIPFVDRALQHSPTAEIWSYAATSWRLAGDPRSEWLEGDPRLVSVVDLSDSLPQLDELAATLRSLHVARGEYLDQSVRGGTQTDGPLLSRIDPTIRKLRQAIVTAVERHVAQLPPPDPRHPLLRERRERRIRFSGSWSVRLRSGGRHSNHVHPQGWISSALYVSLPPRFAGEPDDAGWLTLGQPDDKLQLDLPPFRTVEPKRGRLVLFPSWMWHGTVPFREGERLTVAFDVAPPR